MAKRVFVDGIDVSAERVDLTPKFRHDFINTHLACFSVGGHQGCALPSLVVVCVYNVYTVGLAAPLLRFNTV